MKVENITHYAFDDFRIDVDRQELRKSGKSVALSHKAFQVLLILVARPNQIVEKDQLLSEIWNDSFVEESNLTQYVHILRKVLGQNRDSRPYIETINKIGYRFTGEVQRINDIKGSGCQELLQSSIKNGTRPNLLGDANAHVSGTDGFRGLRLRSTPAKRNFITIAAILVLIGLGVSTLIFKNRNSSHSLRHIRSLAVLPFRSIGEESRDAKLGLGMTDAVITRLSRLDQISVRPTSAILKLADQPYGDPIAIGRELGVDAVLEGTAQRDNNQIRITVQLIDTSNGTSLWAESFNEDYTRIFEMQDSISKRVAQSLSTDLTDRDRELLTRHQTTSQEAQQEYALGIYHWSKRTKEELSKAEECFKRAIEIDPAFALAYAGLADSYNMLAYHKFADRIETYQKSKNAALKALELDDSLGEAYVALAQVQFALDMDPNAARKSLERAVTLSPNSAIAHQRYAWGLVSAGRLDDGVEQMRLAQEYDPLSAVNNVALCNLLIFKRKFNDAEKFCRRAIEIDPRNWDAHISLGESYFLTGRHENAVDEFKRALEIGDDDDYSLAYLGYAYANTAHPADARAIIGKLELRAKNRSFLVVEQAIIYYSLGEEDKAFSLLDKALKLKAIPNTFLFYSPRLDKIKTNPRFQELFNRYDRSTYPFSTS